MKQLGIALLLAVSWSAFTFAQSQTSTSTQESLVPRLVNFSGVATDVNGKPLTGVVGITFFIYKDQQGGAPLWIETQNVSPNSAGRYTVTLGATKSDGVPAYLFTSGEARWVGVQLQGQPERPRVQLITVPYAMKAVDAETVGGLPASAFVLAAPSNSTSAAGPKATAKPLAPGTTPVTTAGGTVNQLARFDAAADITNSLIFDNGTNVGISTTAPTQKLEIDLENVLAKGTDNFQKSGDTAYFYVGDTNHPVEAIYASGLAIGAFKVPQAVLLAANVVCQPGKG